MLTFLAVASRKRLIVDTYEDHATGFLEKNANGKLAVTRVVLRPRVRFGGSVAPSRDGLAKLHEQAHQSCIIANSVLTTVTVESVD
jgi:organic hydroperoxide reductase OsmC/OhrA